jgi:hypothetical protein
MASATATLPEITQSPPTTAVSPAPEIIAYPHPAQDQVAFNISEWESGRLEIAIYNITGELVAKISEFGSNANGHPVLQTSNLGPGVYIGVICLEGKIVKTFKMAVIK